MKQRIISANTKDALNDLLNTAINEVKPENIFSIGSMFWDANAGEYSQTITYIFI